MRRQKSKRSETSRRSSIIYPITRYEKSKRIEGSKWNKLVPYANGDLENSFTSLKIPHRITFLVLHQRYRCVITFLRFDFYFQGRITSRWTRFFLPANVWPEVKGRNLPPRLNDSRWHGQRAIDFPRFSRPRNRFARLPFENPAGIYSVKICRSTQQIATPDLWSRPATINLFTIYRFTPWGKQRAHTLHHNHDA